MRDVAAILCLVVPLTIMGLWIAVLLYGVRGLVDIFRRLVNIK